MFIIKWTNKFSGEIGYVKSVNIMKQHFINTFELGEAKQYEEATAKRVMSNLIAWGEGRNNDFELVAA